MYPNHIVISAGVQEGLSEQHVMGGGLSNTREVLKFFERPLPTHNYFLNQIIQSRDH